MHSSTAPEAVVTGDVQHGREAQVDAEPGQLLPHRRRRGAHVLRAEGGPQASGRRQDGGPRRHQPGQALLVHQRRDAQPGALDQEPLHGIDLLGGLRGGVGPDP